jgi:hypothetical protein
VKTLWRTDGNSSVVSLRGGKIILCDPIKRENPKSVVNKLYDTFPIPEVKGNILNVPNPTPYFTNSNSLPISQNLGELNFGQNTIPMMVSLTNRGAPSFAGLTNSVPVPNHFMNRSETHSMLLSTQIPSLLNLLTNQDFRPKITFHPQSSRPAPIFIPPVISTGENSQSQNIPRITSLINPGFLFNNLKKSFPLLI